MRQMKLVNLYFNVTEVRDALRDWCEVNHPELVVHFSRECSMDWTTDRPRDPELCLSFDGEVEDVPAKSGDETRIFMKR